MPNVTIGPADLQQVIQELAQENVNLRAIRAALVRRLAALEAGDAAEEGQRQTNNQPQHQGDEAGGAFSGAVGGGSSQDGRRPEEAKARKE